MPIYMNVDGVTGDVTAQGHEKWIEVKTFSWGVGRGITMPVGGDTDREASVPSVSEIVVTKDSDAASTDLMKKAFTGDGVTVKFDFVRTGSGQFDPYYTFELTNTLISGFSMDSGGDRPKETLSLNFTKYQFTDTPADPKNDSGSPKRFSYDLSTGVAS